MSHHHAFSIHMHPSARFTSGLIVALAGILFSTFLPANAQSSNDQSLASRVQQLTDAMNETQKQLEKSQQELEQLRAQLASLRQLIAEVHATEATSSSAAELSAAVDQIREQQTVEEAQIATHEQAKVETESKYPLKLTGLVLLNGFVNTAQVDDAIAPTLVLSGSGSSGISLRQTVLGFDARGPRMFGAGTYADLRTDLYGSAPSNSSGYAYADSLLRLRTAHVSLDWSHTQAFFSLDHTILAPNTPASLTDIAVPALAWSGNLWTWNPQIGVNHDVALSASERLRLEGAIIDGINPPQIYVFSSLTTPNSAQPNSTEMSRWSGVEGRLAVLNSTKGLQIGAGGLLIPHRTAGGARFNSWASTVDYRIPLPGRAEVSGNAYRGQALGGLGGGGYKDYVFSYSPLTGYAFRTLDDIGGWIQLSERATQRLAVNAAFGTDQVPASQLRPFAGDPTQYYLNQARNRTYMANVIYSPSAYLEFSLEYKHIQSSPVIEYTATGDVIGIATGYRF